MSDETMRDGAVVRLPVDLLVEVVRQCETVADAASALARLANPWALVVRGSDGTLASEGFIGPDARKELEDRLEQVYRVGTVVAVLSEGKPKKFGLSVRARIQR